VPPELVFEVLSPTDRWKEVLRKVAEYLNAGVICVCVVDPKQQTVMRYYHDRPEDTLTGGQSLELPDTLPGFSMSLDKIFEA
jgi:Uma2 family endonuclease